MYDHEKGQPSERSLPFITFGLVATILLGGYLAYRYLEKVREALPPPAIQNPAPPPL